MKTYIANIETPNGTQTIQLAAANVEEAYGQLAERMQSGSGDLHKTSMRETSQLASPEAFKAMANASGSLIACLILLVVADKLVRKWLQS